MNFNLTPPPKFVKNRVTLVYKNAVLNPEKAFVDYFKWSEKDNAWIGC